MSNVKKIQTPLNRETIADLHCGDKVLITGTIYTARDAAHKRMVEALDRGEDLPVDWRNQIVYYAGPTPAPPGRIIGSCGPTTSGRMDTFTPRMLELGLAGMIGKGPRSKEVIQAIVDAQAVYFAAVGGAAALIASRIKDVSVVAYDDLGPEAIRRMVVEDYPCIVAVDSKGQDLYELGPEKYRKTIETLS
ncbi:MAG: Fe-S-containing hydro-lyase [Eggerthellaceae bacterium]|jgi:fumarate hydratase subunit beta